MPELPEVETIRRGLERVLIGRVVERVEVSERRSCTVSQEELVALIVGARIETVARRGKLLIIGLDNDTSLLVHLRMTGQLIFKVTAVGGEVAVSADSRDESAQDFGGGYPNRSFVGTLPDKTTRIVVTFSDGSHLYFNDQRKFGYLKPVPTGEVHHDDFVSSLGPEPLDTHFSVEAFAARLPKNSKRSIKSLLLDQTVIAGIGNIYADESLFLAGILPHRAVAGLTEAEVTKLHAAIRACMEQSITDGGSTMKDYVDSEGLRGEYLDLHAAVFNRTGLPCKNCGAPIRKTKVAGRGTHYCENCQK